MHFTGTIGAQLKTPAPKIPRTSQCYRAKGLKEALNWSPIMPRDTSLSDSRGNSFQSVGQEGSAHIRL